MYIVGKVKSFQLFSIDENIYILNRMNFMGCIFLILFACLKSRFLNVEPNSGLRRPVPAASSILYSNVRGLSKNLSDLTVVSSQDGILLYPDTLVSYLRHVSELLIARFGRQDMLCKDRMPWVWGLAAYVRDDYEAFRQLKFESDCCEMLVLRLCGARHNFYVFSLYRNPDLDDPIYKIVHRQQWLPCWLRIWTENCMAAMAAVLTHGLWVNWMAGFYHHESSRCYSFCHRNCVVLRAVGCWLTHACGGTRDLLMTDVPDLVRVADV